MNETIFWHLIEISLAESRVKPNAIFQILQEKLARLSGDEILRFDQILHELVRVGFRSNLLAAATIINAGSDLDELSDFEAFILMQGKQIWDQALKNPDSLADLEYAGDFVCTEIWSVPERAYEQATGQEDFEMMHFEYQPQNLIGATDIWQDSKGKPDNQKLRTLLPKLYQKYFE